jgi:hypothetical protein
MSHPHKSTGTPIDVPWKESRFHSHGTQAQDELEENDDMFDMYVTSRMSKESGLMDGKFIHSMLTDLASYFTRLGLLIPIPTKRSNLNLATITQTTIISPFMVTSKKMDKPCIRLALLCGERRNCCASIS